MPLWRGVTPSFCSVTPLWRGITPSFCGVTLLWCGVTPLLRSVDCGALRRRCDVMDVICNHTFVGVTSSRNKAVVVRGNYCVHHRQGHSCAMHVHILKHFHRQQLFFCVLVYGSTLEHTHKVSFTNK
jgi:hypothetical protein